MEKNLRELAILAEKEKQQEGEGNQEAFVDNVIMYEVLSELKDIAARKDGITWRLRQPPLGNGRSAVPRWI